MQKVRVSIFYVPGSRAMAHFLYIFGKTLIDDLNMIGLPLIWIIFIGFTLLSWLVSSQLQSRFKKYSKIPTANGMW